MMIEIKFVYQFRNEWTSGVKTHKVCFDNRNEARKEIVRVKEDGLWVGEDMIIMPQYVLNAFLSEVEDKDETEPSI